MKKLASVERTMAATADLPEARVRMLSSRRDEWAVSVKVGQEWFRAGHVQRQQRTGRWWGFDLTGGLTAGGATRDQATHALAVTIVQRMKRSRSNG
jgi:hypothetical protein